MGQQKADPAAPGYCAEARETHWPVHEVTLDPFFFGKYELTQGQWLRFTGDNPSYYHAGKDIFGNVHTLAHPVEQVSWTDCRKQLLQRGLQLPTEAQWEYAARATTTTRFWWGTEKSDFANPLRGNVADAWTRKQPGAPPWGFEDWEDGWAASAPVGSFEANPWGIHDVIGNVWEWCADGFGSYELPATSGSGAREGAAQGEHPLRGGAFINLCTIGCAYREGGTPEQVDQAVGVRAARRIVQPSD